ncbi:acetyl-CoA hydrolase/transferase family protein [Arsenicicoccus dermatophilus]|uniref:acetyl-CoA hydrolase/transferase family protein n=1 Tax=Arsenicicoccus dermatophilus TaxID=1076331 RepID=UPI00391753FF
MTTSLTAQDTYRRKLTSAHDAVRLVRDGETIVVPTGVGEPPSLLEALSERRRELHGVAVEQIIPFRSFDYYDPETVDHVRHTAYFYGGPTRPGGQAGWIPYRPNYFTEMPSLIRQGLFPCDVVFAMASEMDEHGYFAISLSTDYTMAAIEKARCVVLEVNPRVPYAYGECHVHVDQVAAVVEDDRPLTTVGLPEIGPVQQAIGRYVADLIPDGATIQIGFGAIPDAVVMQLTDRKDLGVHTEMIGDGILSLVEAGVVTNRLKNLLPGRSVATFALGSERLYSWMHRNRALEMHPVDFTNDPYVVGGIDDMHTINATVEIDFVGQCCSESMGWMPYSGTGGQSDFVRAANRSKGGKSFIVTPSTAKGDTISRVVPTLKPGAHVSTSKNDVNYVVTEYGVAQLRGKTNQERCRALIDIAHPKFREELGIKAQEMHIL